MWSQHIVAIDAIKDAYPSYIPTMLNISGH